MEIKEFNKKLAELNICKEKVDECESILDRYKEAEKNLVYYQEKYREYSSTVKQSKIIAENNDKQLLEINQLNKEIEKFKKLCDDNFMELKRLGRLEKDYIQLENELKTKKDEYFEIVNQKATLSFENETFKEKLRAQDHDFKDKFDEMEFLKATLENKLNVKNAEFIKLSEESKEKIAHLEFEINHNQLKIKDLTEQNTILEEKNKEALNNHQNVYTENLTLKSNIEQLNGLLKGVEAKLDSSKLELKTLSKKYNLKVKQFHI